MSKTCDGNCNNCSSSDCKDRDLHEKPNELSKIKKVVGIVSGKGGVGKSIVTSMLAVLAEREGLNVAILDADITGPSIPQSFGITGKADACDLGLFPVQSHKGIKVMSINLLLEKVTDPVIWRGPVIANMVKQFWTDVIWDNVDIMFIDMPPGTGDVPLTVFQSIPIDGIIVVTSPQQLVSMIVTKAVNMAEMMKIPVLGIIENMSYIKCPDCGKDIEVFGKSNIESIASGHNLDILGRIPIDTKLAAACDSGLIELFDGNWLDKAIQKIISMPAKEI